MPTYKLLRSTDGSVDVVLRDNKDSIPFCEDNADYQQYLKWLEAGNTPEPAEEQQ